MKTFLHLFLFPFFTLNLLFTSMPVDEARRIDDATLSVTTEQLAQLVQSFAAGDEIVGDKLGVLHEGRSVLPVRSAIATRSDSAAEKINRHSATHTVVP